MTPEGHDLLSATGVVDATGPLGILAAGGALPIEIAAAAEARGRKVHIVALQGIAGDHVTRFPHNWASLGQINRILGSFRRAGCREIIISGAMQRPDVLRQRVDFGFFRHLPTVMRLTRGGDDSLLRKVVRFFEGEGFIVRGVGDIAPVLLPGEGQLGRHAPDQQHGTAIELAARTMTALGPFDIGQAVVATAEAIIAVEGVTGTDAMLNALGPGGAGAGLGRGAVLVKLAKPNQELRVDLPTIGPVTIERAAAAGLTAVVVSAGAAIIMDRPQTLAAADAAGLAVVGRGTSAPADQESVPSVSSGTSSLQPLVVLARRAPTPAERSDIAVARRLLPVMARHGAGRGAVIAREHVLAVSGQLPIAEVILPLAQRRHWGLRTFRGQIGVLALDLSAPGAGQTQPPPALDAALFTAVRDAKLAGIVCLGGALPETGREEIIGLAHDAKVFLMAEAT